MHGEIIIIIIINSLAESIMTYGITSYERKDENHNQYKNVSILKILKL